MVGGTGSLVGESGMKSQGGTQVYHFLDGGAVHDDAGHWHDVVVEKGGSRGQSARLGGGHTVKDGLAVDQVDLLVDPVAHQKHLVLEVLVGLQRLGCARVVVICGGYGGHAGCLRPMKERRGLVSVQGGEGEPGVARRGGVLEVAEVVHPGGQGQFPLSVGGQYTSACHHRSEGGA